MNTERYNIYLGALLYGVDKLMQLIETDNLTNIKAVLAKYPIDTESQIFSQAIIFATGGSSIHHKESYEKAFLYSIFEGLMKEPGKICEYRLPIKELVFLSDFFPTKEVISANRKEIKILLAKLDADLGKVNISSSETFPETLLALLAKYCSRIPSVFVSQTDVSLYDSSKMIAAMAVCLFDYYEHCRLNKKEVLPKASQAFLLIGADISGIQSFIYDIISTHAAKNLKGRSFYLQLLIESILAKILHALHLNSAHIIYSSGGGFYLLAPNIPHNLQTLADDIAAKIFEQHHTSLFVSIDSSPIAISVLYDKNIAETWQHLIGKLNQQKRQRYKKQLISHYDDFFEPLEIGGKQIRDAITGEEISDKQLERAKELKEGRFVQRFDKGAILAGNERFIKYTTDEQISLGVKLRSADYWVMSNRELKNGLKGFNPCNLGVYHYFIEKENLATIKNTASDLRINTFNDFSFLESSASENFGIRSFTFYGGNKFPADEEGNMKTFNELAGLSEGDDNEGFKRLGVLRMDVDNLGQMFISGFKTGEQTFARYAALSRNLDYFFKGYLNYIWTQNTAFKQNTVILYSGGDDLFIVGKWNDTIDFANEIRSKFAEWVCYNQAITLSGGLNIVGAKFPISKAADNASVAEKLAKNHIFYKGDKENEKNAMTIFDFPLHWNHEFSLVYQLKKELESLWQKEESTAKSLLGKIQLHYFNYLDQKKRGANESWRWIIAYDFARAAKQYKEDRNLVDMLEKIKKGVFSDEYDTFRRMSDKNKPFIELLSIAARWAELSLRTK